jgi:glycerol-3-phosphate acyltransferase PlsY
MHPAAAAIPAVALTYLLGSIPTGYLVPKWVKGIDIREHGSRNVGATNVGRVMGFKYFVLVMLADLLKGFLPTFFFPSFVEKWTGPAWPELPVMVAAAAILGHNFPVFLGFRGGKGVATSLGAVLALDPVAGGIAAVGFLFVLAVTRIVSVSSILGAACFLFAYISRVESPWDRRHAAMTGVLLVLYILLVFRHRANLGRLWKGTEPRVSFRKKRQDPPPPSEDRAGRVVPLVLAGVALMAGVAGVVGWAARPREVGPVACGPFVLEQVAKLGTGQQRAGDLVFLEGGNRLVVASTRYNRALFLEVAPDGALKVAKDVALDGRPVALASRGDSVLVLQRPTGDARHLEEGYWEVFNAAGDRLGPKVRVGWDPDDLVLSADGTKAFVLTSGHAEGETGRPDPALAVLDLTTHAQAPRTIGRISFTRKGDDPEDLSLSASGDYAVVALAGTAQVAAVDLTGPDGPVEIGRQPLMERELPTLSEAAEGDPILMPVCTERATVVVPSLHAPLLVSTLPEASALELVEGTSRRLIGQVPLRWSSAWKEVRPTGLAYSPERRLLAVANRAGGIHVLKLVDTTPTASADDGAIARR